MRTHSSCFRSTARLFLTAFALCSLSSADIHADSTGTTASRVVIEAYIDGPTEMRVTSTGIYWIAKADKPGQHDKKDEPTYINDKAWKPVWGKPEQHQGPDRSQEFSFPCDPAKLKYKFIMATGERDAKKPLNRDQVVTKMEGNEFSIFIPEGQAGACWYKFSLAKDSAAGTAARPFPGSTKATPAPASRPTQ